MTADARSLSGPHVSCHFVVIISKEYRYGQTQNRLA
jgi:hypothetical protein